ncbi:hypothetical protein QUA81_04755 [Microcoleus sp. F6_B4]
MDSDKAKKIAEVLLKFAAKKGIRTLMFATIGTLLMPIAGDAVDAVEGIQEIISLFTDDDLLA